MWAAACSFYFRSYSSTARHRYRAATARERTVRRLKADCLDSPSRPCYYPSMSQTKIIVKNNGSIRVEGDFVIVDVEGKEFGLGGRTAVSLCRCGHSQTKPFCDGSHKLAGFEDTVVARDLPPVVPQP